MVAAVAALVLAVGGAVGGWHRVAEGRAEAVSVGWVSAPRCEGARVELQRDRGLDSGAGPVILAERGMRCTLRVRVRNDGEDTVALTHAVLPFMGRGGGAVLKVDQSLEPDVWVTPGDSTIDLARVIDRDLGPGESLDLVLPLAFRDRGCSGGARGSGTARFYGFPQVEVRALGRAYEVAAAEDLVHTQVGPASGCREMRR
ncbi:hypothetical protein [Nocardioides sp. zg-DK7169]|uniref:hypothetical protein n=1 Tax=Nocardioides sp. zg-DK7169 TaxID=2736600 RepID=UPI0015538DF2|nr:hypothetical protein [Nocardioides sp. zg-DK7169]NPC95925.1 hypothetical protein [Nocardioides sp. zg-DK7169]